MSSLQRLLELSDGDCRPAESLRRLGVWTGDCRRDPISSIGFERAHNAMLAYTDADTFARALVKDMPGRHRLVKPRSLSANRRGSAGRAGMNQPVRLGLRENAAQFSLLVGINALVGGMVGLERSVDAADRPAELRTALKDGNPGIRARFRPGQGVHQPGGRRPR